jgi:transcriptional regulator with GAF, ATPase, and Fis domain
VAEGTTLAEALRALAQRLVDELDADAAIISRVLGDVLIVVAHVPGTEPLSQGQGYLVSDYPPTQLVLRTGEPAMLTLEDADVDPAEAELLRELGYGTLLMLPLQLDGQRWGLVEVYREGVRRFGAGDVTRAQFLSRLR